MRIIADENCDSMIMAALRNAGHDVLSVREDQRGGSDKGVFEMARMRGRVVLTNDLDFGFLSERERHHPPAVILMRLDRLSRPARANRVVQVLRTLGAIDGHLVTIEASRIRVRGLK